MPNCVGQGRRKESSSEFYHPFLKPFYSTGEEEERRLEEAVQSCWRARKHKTEPLTERNKYMVVAVW